jgi:hypothetical protein
MSEHLIQSIGPLISASSSKLVNVLSSWLSSTPHLRLSGKLTGMYRYQISARESAMRNDIIAGSGTWFDFYRRV